MMTVYIPFEDGSSVAFDGELFTIQRSPVKSDNSENSESNKACMAEVNWADKKKRLKMTRALEAVWNEQRDMQRRGGVKRIYGK